MCMSIKIKKGNKTRVNITVDRELLDKAKTQMELFGGKLSTMFNAYLSDFVTTMDKKFNENQKSLQKRVDELEKKLKKMEEK